MTVFLTTQYLEEADVLADRVGIIDHGRIVAEGTPASLKEEIGRPSVHVIPCREDDRPRIATLMARFGEPLGDDRDLAVRLRDGLGLDGRRSARWTRKESSSTTSSCGPPHSTTSSSPRRGGRSRAPRTGETGTLDAMSALATQVGALAQRSVTRTARQPASAIPPLIFPVALLLVNSGGLKASTLLPGFPTDSFLAFALAVPFIQGALFSTMNAGTDLARDIQTGFFSRLSLTPVRGSALLAGQLTGIVVLGVLQAVFYISVGLLLGVRFAAGPAGIALLLVYAALVAVGLRGARLVPGACGPARASRSRGSSRCSSSSSSSPR